MMLDNQEKERKEEKKNSRRRCKINTCLNIHDDAQARGLSAACTYYWTTRETLSRTLLDYTFV
jgi:hypothetical protein